MDAWISAWVIFAQWYKNYARGEECDVITPNPEVTEILNNFMMGARVAVPVNTVVVDTVEYTVYRTYPTICFN